MPVPSICAFMKYQSYARHIIILYFSLCITYTVLRVYFLKSSSLGTELIDDAALRAHGGRPNPAAAPGARGARVAHAGTGDNQVRVDISGYRDHKPPWPGGVDRKGEGFPGEPGTSVIRVNSP